MSEQPAHMTHETLYGDPVVCLHLMGIVLVMSPVQYDQAITRGKLFRRAQANTARLARAEARDQSAQLQWIDRNES